MNTLLGLSDYWRRVGAVAYGDFVSGMGWGWAYPTIFVPLVFFASILYQWKQIKGSPSDCVKIIWNDGSKPTIIAMLLYFGLCVVRAPYLMERAAIAQQPTSIPSTDMEHLDLELASSIYRFAHEQEQKYPDGGELEFATIQGLFLRRFANQTDDLIDALDISGTGNTILMKQACRNPEDLRSIRRCGKFLEDGAKNLSGVQPTKDHRSKLNYTLMKNSKKVISDLYHELADFGNKRTVGYPNTTVEENTRFAKETVTTYRSKFLKRVDDANQRAGYFGIPIDGQKTAQCKSAEVGQRISDCADYMGRLASAMPDAR